MKKMVTCLISYLKIQTRRYWQPSLKLLKFFRQFFLFLCKSISRLAHPMKCTWSSRFCNVLSFILYFRVSQYKEFHNMDTRNLALCLWPTILRIDFMSYDKMATGTKVPAEIVQTLIEQCGFFFHGEDEVWHREKSLFHFSQDVW